MFDEKDNEKDSTLFFFRTDLSGPTVGPTPVWHSLFDSTEVVLNYNNGGELHKYHAGPKQLGR